MAVKIAHNVSVGTDNTAAQKSISTNSESSPGSRTLVAVILDMVTSVVPPRLPTPPSQSSVVTRIPTHQPPPQPLPPPPYHHQWRVLSTMPRPSSLVPSPSSFLPSASFS